MQRQVKSDQRRATWVSKTPTSLPVSVLIGFLDVYRPIALSDSSRSAWKPCPHIAKRGSTSISADPRAYHQRQRSRGGPMNDRLSLLAVVARATNPSRPHSIRHDQQVRSRTLSHQSRSVCGSATRGRSRSRWGAAKQFQTNRHRSNACPADTTTSPLTTTNMSRTVLTVLPEL